MEKKLRIYWGKDQLYEKELAKIENSKISKRNKDLILKFHNNLFAKECGETRVAKVSSQLRKIAEDLDKDLDEIFKQDIECLIANYNKNKEWKDATKADYRRAIKQFYLWFEDEDPRLEIPENGNLAEKIYEYKRIQREAQKFYKYVKKEIKTRYKARKPEFKEILTNEDIQKVIDNGAANSKERAFLKILYEGGFRIGELLRVQTGDITFRENSISIQVDGKTGQRSVTLVQSMGLLSRWLEDHPDSENPNAYLWTSHNPRNMHEPLRYNGVVKLIKRCFKKAGIDKRHNAHWFRHSKATSLARYIPDQMLCGHFGWVPGSDQVKTYCHIHESQVEDAILTVNGIKKEDEEESKPTKCSSCGMMNEADVRYCHKCGKALKLGIYLQDEEKKKIAIEEAIELMARISSDPELKKKFDEFKRK